MWHNNIAEKSSTRLHAPPGGRQSYNIFGEPSNPQQAQPQQQQPQQIQQNQQQQQQTQQQQPQQSQAPAGGLARANIRDNNIFGTSDSTSAPSQGQPQQRVNNIWGSDDNSNRSSTRVINRPGGQSSMGSILFGQSEDDEKKKQLEQLQKEQAEQQKLLEEQQKQQQQQGQQGQQQQQQAQAQPERRRDNNIFGTDPVAAKPVSGGRSNQTSANNPFSSAPVEQSGQRSSTRVSANPGGGSRVNNIW